MLLLLVVLASVLAVASADCDACVQGRCHTRTTLARGLHIPDQMAIDRKNGILYVHTDSDVNATFFHENLKIQLVPRQDFSGLAVDQDTQVLYTGDDKNVHKYMQGSTNTSTKVTLTNQDLYEKPNLLFYKDCLIYTKQSRKGLFFTKNNMKYNYYVDFVNFTISDFVVQVGCEYSKIYFVANETVYVYKGLVWPRTTEVVENKKYVLSTDQYDNIFFGDATANVVFKMDNKTDGLVPYAAYESGSIDKFVFDNNNNIVSYDSSDGSFSLWKPLDNSSCTIEAPHSKYRIIKSTLEQNGFIY